MVSSITSLKIVPAIVQQAAPILQTENKNVGDNEIVDFVGEDYIS